MKNRWIKWAAGLLAGSLLIAPVAHAAPEETASLLLNGSSAESGKLEVRGGQAYMPARTASELLGFLADYNRASHTLTLLRPNASLTMKLGSREAEIDGRRVKSAAAFAENGRVYVPLNALSAALKTKADWKAASGSAALEDPDRCRMVSSGGRTVWVFFATGEIYSLESGLPKKLRAADVSDLDWGTADVRNLGDGAYLLTVEREYGAAMQTVHNRHQFLVKDGSVQKQTHYRYSGMYASSEMGPASLPAQRAYLTDGKVVDVVGAGGSAAAVYDLEELTGQEGPFIVESVTADYLLVRAFATLQPTVIDLASGNSALLYERLPDPDEVRAWEEMSGDTGELLLLQSRLRFVEQKGDRLIFAYKRIAPGKDSGREERFDYVLKRS
ncbi:copper amine oxidase N-terminal domain-containing protein [Saccharibacillus alkalitolerans]|uniref:Copper amine oxidase N-terminal domain-containing protein n=1 Tax=Saccharibacillus alkalitolerans TaxID=2705290 RepID=A0ABX0F1M4_9BACL|nr:copper amine oxidase N-terminal domain-containing protein [Saccharibacillus alkalitolerans]NGZ73944.1 copper amine oxidase N-terminal domain-containing protein [Saccharibacillus alkalitolerans]